MKTRIISIVLSMLVVILSVFSLSVSAKEVENKDFGTNGGIEERIREIEKVYDSDSYFTVSGNACGSNQCSDCELANIPQRGNLPSGEESAKECWNSWSCCSFARYVFYNVFKCNPESQIKVSQDELSYGDYVYLSGRHYVIYLGQDDTNWYVYHGNGDGQCGVEYMDALPKSMWSFTFGYHAKNYFDVDGNISYSKEPDLPKLSSADGGVKLEMEPIDGVHKYMIYRKSATNIFGKFTEVGISKGNSFVDKTVENATTYFYTVQALNSDNKAISTYDMYGTKIFYLSAPTINNVSIDNQNNININWDAIDGAKRYQVYLKVNNGEYMELGEKTASLFYLYRDHQKGNTYSFKVQGISRKGTLSAMSEEYTISM